MPTKTNITTYDLAKLANTTQATVSRALRDDPSISVRTKLRIKALAEKYGYRPNLLARSLSEGKTYTIGVLMSAYHLEVASAKVLAIDRLARERGYHIYIGYTKGELPLAKELATDFISRGVDGLLIYGTFEGWEPQEIKKLTTIKPNLPIVFLESNFDFPCYQVLSDKRSAYIEAIKYLKSKSYKQVYAFWKDLPERKLPIDPRYIGFIEGLKLNNFTDKGGVIKLYKSSISTALPDSDKGIAELQEKIFEFFTTHKDYPFAIMCYNDFVAIQAVSIANRLNIKVPEQVGIVGFDDITATRLIVPPLTTIAQPVEGIARTAVELLLKLIETPKDKHPEPKPIYVPCELRIRASA